MHIRQHALRVYADPERFETTTRFYELLQSISCERRVTIAENGSEAAKIGTVLVLSGASGRLAPVRDVGAVFYVDSLEEAASWLERSGAEIVRPSRPFIAGRNPTARHPDGLVVEYAEPLSSRTHL